jgi:membrane-associated phospholipid phosphatase
MAAQQVDIDILKAINQQKETNFKNNFFNATANSVTVINLAAPLSLLTAGIINKDKKLQQNALFMAGGYIVSTIVTQGAKRIIQRERPFNTYSFITKKSEGGGYSMPSGHTSAAFNTATALSLLYPKWYVIAPSFVWASLVGYSRMYQGVHYPSDVVVGALVGSGSAWLAYKAQKWINKKRLKNK